MTQSLVLTGDQLAAQEAFCQFLLDPDQPVFVLRGYSGCGKSTLVRHLLDKMPDFNRMVRLIDPGHVDWPIQLTATTNKAAETLAQLSGMDVTTIHSFLGLRVNTDYTTGKVTLVPKRRDASPEEGWLLFIDEASYVDSQLLQLIFKRTKNCKIVFVGDPAQLTQVLSRNAPVFDAGFPGAALTQVVRQAEGNPIITLATQFRHTVNTGEWPQFKPDGHHIKHVDRTAFLLEAEQEFSRPDWKNADSKILAWTNKCVVGYNQYMRNQVKGDPHFQKGDYAICNSFITVNKVTLKTDQLVQIEDISEDVTQLGVLGNHFYISGIGFFMPKTLESRSARLRKAKAEGAYEDVATIESQWIDLRAAFSSTINKAQGSTHRKVFIDLDDVSRCNDANQLARMLYVGVSRASDQVVLTGDLA